MQSVPRHISHFIRKSLSRHTDTPPLAEAILGLTEQRFKYFSHLVIPTQASITTLDWVIVRVDCIFLIHDCQDRHADLAHIQSLQEQWTATQQKALELAALLRQVDYHGVVQPILATHAPQECNIADTPCMMTITDLPAYLAAYSPLKQVMKPAYAIALCRAINKAMAARRYLNLAMKCTHEEREDFYWMQDFKPPRIPSSQRDFAFRQASKPQAIDKADKWQRG